MPDLPADSYEAQVARAKARRPRLILLDALYIYSLVDERVVGRDGFGADTVAVETFILELQSEKNLKAGAPTFKVQPVLRIASEAWPKTPDANTQIVEEFPVREATVVRLMTEFLDMNGYFKKNDEFLWGTRVLTKKEGLSYGS